MGENIGQLCVSGLDAAPGYEDKQQVQGEGKAATRQCAVAPRESDAKTHPAPLPLPAPLLVAPALPPAPVLLLLLLPQHLPKARSLALFAAHRRAEIVEGVVLWRWNIRGGNPFRSAAARGRGGRQRNGKPLSCLSLLQRAFSVFSRALRRPAVALRDTRE